MVVNVEDGFLHDEALIIAIITGLCFLSHRVLLEEQVYVIITIETFFSRSVYHIHVLVLISEPFYAIKQLANVLAKWGGE